MAYLSAPHQSKHKKFSLYSPYNLSLLKIIAPMANRHLMSIASRNHTIEIDAKEIIKKAQEDKEIEAVIGLNRIGLENEKIADALNMKVEKVLQILDNQSK